MAMLAAHFVEPRVALPNSFAFGPEVEAKAGSYKRTHSFPGYISSHLSDFEVAAAAAAQKESQAGRAARKARASLGKGKVTEGQPEQFVKHSTEDEWKQRGEVEDAAQKSQLQNPVVAPSPTSESPPPPQCQFSTPEVSDEMLTFGVKLQLERMISTPHLRLPFNTPPSQQLECVSSCFHSTKEIGISLSDYFSRFVEYCPCDAACFVLALVYIDRIGQKFKGVPFNRRTSHRLLLTSITLGIKFLEDEILPDSHLAAVAGVTVDELNNLQKQFLELVDWRLNVDAEDFERYRTFLLQAA